VDILELVTAKIIDYEIFNGVKPTNLYLGRSEMVQLRLLIFSKNPHPSSPCLIPKELMGLNLLEVRTENHFGLS